MSHPELSLPERTITAVTQRADGEELWTLDDHDEIVAWLDARGLEYHFVDPEETTEQKVARLFGGRADDLPRLAAPPSGLDTAPVPDGPAPARHPSRRDRRRAARRRG